MDSLSLATTTTTSFQFLPIREKVSLNGKREIGFRKRSKFVMLAAREDGKEPKLDPLDQMELRFGRLLGEDPKLTLAKIMARKTNPDASFLDVEKSFYKNKGKIVEVEELPFDVSDMKRPSTSSNGLNLTRPVPKKGVSFNAEPVAQEIKKPIQPVGKGLENNNRSTVPNVILRKKPNMFAEDNVEDKSAQSRMRIRPNLTLKMRSDQTNEKFSDMTLLRKPEALNAEKKQNSSCDGEDKAMSNGNQIGTPEQGEGKGQYTGYTLLNEPEVAKVNVEESSEDGDVSVTGEEVLNSENVPGMQPPKKSISGSTEEETAENDQSGVELADSTRRLPVEAALHGKPERLEKFPKETLKLNDTVQDAAPVNSGSYVDANDPVDVPSTSPQEGADWQRAEVLLKTGNREEVEIVSSSTRGFVVSFGSLLGFLPYRNLVAKWKFLAFESWLRQKGLDPSMYRQNIGILGCSDISGNEFSPDSRTNQKKEGEISRDMKLDDLFRIYDQEKLKFLSSFVGQKIKVNVVLADRKLGKLVFSVRPKEKEELVERKRNLMAKLQVGDVVKCCVKKITYFGIFVEVEGVPALIHQTEVSWDATLDPSSYLKLGQMVEAKVHQLDYTLERIFLSLKEIAPDPLIEALESVVGDRSPLDGRLQAAEADTEWADVESLVKELQKVEGIQSVSKGRFFLSPGLAPTFQVYMASMFENQYKLLARSGNKVQEVIVQANLDKEQMKSTILSCTNRVE